MKKEELENLRTLLENTDLSQLDLPKIKRISEDLDLSGIDISQLVLPSLEDIKTSINSYTPTTKTEIIKERADLSQLDLPKIKRIDEDLDLSGIDISQLVLPSLEEINEDTTNKLKR